MVAFDMGPPPSCVEVRPAGLDRHPPGGPFASGHGSLGRGKGIFPAPGRIDLRWKRIAPLGLLAQKDRH
jgi:hypothetical protein